MEWHESVFDLIDMRSFSNLWFWLALSVVWSTTSHWILGVPFDLVQRASRHGGQAEQDLHDIVRINTNRILYISGVSGMWILGFTCFALTSIAILGFYFKVEFCQAMFLLGLPLSFVGLLSLDTARRIRKNGLQGEALIRKLRLHRVFVQLIGIVAIFVTGFWGMYQNLTIGVLGG
ncbi:component of SufBCD complex [Actibacterium lipolyticum]|uniref:Component of SufBCD complex n=1 Tax=Actibacterium lipolyticum TaxID=1524263 RepID=A0A238JZE7_9RHOB|nr:component of SufBCD complex [Actibacterium lipolyticum]SMX35076.1 hypothetical protein COL8621_01637 [Actibacterium lipolyticum]